MEIIQLQHIQVKKRKYDVIQAGKKKRKAEFSQVKVDQVQAGKIIIQLTHIQDIQVNQVQVPKIKIKANVIQVHLANVNLHQHIQENQVHVNLASTGNLV